MGVLGGGVGTYVCDSEGISGLECALWYVCVCIYLSVCACTSGWVCTVLAVSP